MSETEDGSSPAKKRRVTNVTELSSEADSSMVDMETQKALEDIDVCQNEIDGLNERASEEILFIEQKYNKLRKPHFEKRNGLIKQIPNFWVTAFINHPQLSHLISQAEEQCLHFLTAVEVCEFEDIKSGYSITFRFSENPYFSNEVISKKYHLVVAGSDPHTEATKIDWKSGKDLSKSFQSKKVGRHIPGAGPRVGSFFSWFQEKGNPLADKIADIIKDDIWPNPVQYYLAPDIEVEENGRTDSDSEDDSVVIVGDDSDDDEDDLDSDDIYEVDDIDMSGDMMEESVEYLEVDDDDDDDDDDDVEVIESDTELETTDVADSSQVLDTTTDIDKSQDTTDVSKLDDTDTPQTVVESSSAPTDTAKTGDDPKQTVSSSNDATTNDIEKSTDDNGASVDGENTEVVNGVDKDVSDGDNKDTNETADDGGTDSAKVVTKDGDTAGKSDGVISSSQGESGGGGDG